jgi:hypothetical protein
MEQDTRKRSSGRHGVRHNFKPDEQAEPGDELGTWAKEELQQMQERFERAILRELRSKQR